MSESSLGDMLQNITSTAGLYDLSQVLTDDVMIYVHISLNITIRIIISAVGIITNLLNMIIFSKLGLKDSMSVGLFALSFTDLLVNGNQLASCVCYITEMLYPSIAPHAAYFGYIVFGWAVCTGYQISCWITVMISTERCFCVVSPFTVKQIFTRVRCVIVIVTIYVTHIGAHMTILVTDKGMGELISTPGSNSSARTHTYTLKVALRQDVINYIKLIFTITELVFMWLLSQAIVIVCAVWMGYALEASSKVRHIPSTLNPDHGSAKHEIQSQKKELTLSSRERRLVKVVLSLALILTVCNVPKVVWSCYIFSRVKAADQPNLTSTLWLVVFGFSLLGCSVSMVVYFQLNTNYRRMCNHIFRWSMKGT